MKTPIIRLASMVLLLAIITLAFRVPNTNIKRRFRVPEIGVGGSIGVVRDTPTNQSIEISADRRAAELQLNQRKLATEMKRIRFDSKKALQLLGAAYQHLAIPPDEMHTIDDEIELSYEQLVDILYQDNGMVLSDAEVPVVIDGKSTTMIIEVLCKAKTRNVRAAMMLLKRSVDGVIYNRQLREKCLGQTIVHLQDEENDNNELCTVYKAILSMLGRMQSQSMSSYAERRQQNAVYSNLILHLLCEHIPSVAQIQPGLQLYHAALNALGRHGAHEAISSLLNDMKDPTPDRMAYQIAISSLAKCGKCLDATQLLQQMRLKGFSPDIVCYNELLIGIARQAGGHQSRNNIDSGIVEQNPVSWHKLALEILQDIESQSDLAASITDQTYNSVIACCGKEKAWEAAASIASKASNYTIINNIDSENDEQTSSYFSNLDVFEKNGRGNDAWWRIGTYSSGTDRSLIIGIQPHRNPKLNGMSLVFYRDDLQGNRVKVGRVLLKNDPITSTKFYYSSIIGMEVSTNMRGEGLSKVLIAIWLDICLQTAAYPRAAVMNKPLIALVLSKFGFVPGDGGTKCVLVRLENDGKDQNNPQLFGLYSPQRKSLDGAFSHRVLRTQNIKLLTSLPDSSGQKGVDVVIKTTFSHPHKPPADDIEDTDEMQAERTLLKDKINAALNKSSVDTDMTASVSGKMTYSASSEKLSKAFLFV